MELAAERAKTLCKRLYDDCGGDVPMVVWQTFSLLLGAMVDREVDEAVEAEEVPPSTQDEGAIDPETAAMIRKETSRQMVPEPDTDEEGIDHQVTPDTTTEEDPS